jgi:hypothetical protein
MVASKIEGQYEHLRMSVARKRLERIGAMVDANAVGVQGKSEPGDDL